MFGKNTIHGEKSFADAGDKLLVTSMFMTLQGEGPLSGRPAVFLRLAYCQLSCSFCDTFFDDGQWMSPDEVDAALDKTVYDYFNGFVPKWADSEVFNHGAHQSTVPGKLVLIITGGEPTLQKNIVPFIERFGLKYKRVQIESNGILSRDNLPDDVILVVSPKCIEKDGRAVAYLKPNPKVLERADCLKFVMSADPFSPYFTIPDWALEWLKRNDYTKPIYVSPMNIYNRLPAAAMKLRQEGGGSTIGERSTIDEVISFWEPGLLDMEQNQKNHEHAAQYAIRHGLFLSIQQHLYASLP